MDTCKIQNMDTKNVYGATGTILKRTKGLIIAKMKTVLKGLFKSLRNLMGCSTQKKL